MTATLVRRHRHPVAAPVRSRWCTRCGDLVTDLGHHWPDGSFDIYSIPVTDEEITASLERSGYDVKNAHYRRRVRHAIALGRHIGTRI